VPDCRTGDSAGSASLPLSAVRFTAKIRGFLTHSRLDATYTERAKRRSPNREASSRLRQRRWRVAVDVHNNKEMGP